VYFSITLCTRQRIYLPNKAQHGRPS